MKKLFTLIAMALVTLSASADQLDLSLEDLGSGWESSYDAATKTITYDAGWKGRGWWVDPADYSAYDVVVIDFEEQAIGVRLVIEYNDATSTNQDIDAGKTQLIATLDAEGKSSVKQIYIQSHAVGSVVLKRAYLATSDDVEKEPVKDIELSTGEDLTLAAGAYGWNCPQGWLAKDLTDYNAIVFEIASVEGACKAAVQLVPNAGGDAENLEVLFAESSEAKTYALDISDYKTLNQFAYQNTNKGEDEEEADIKATSIVVTKVYLTEKKAEDINAAEDTKVYSVIGTIVGNWDTDTDMEKQDDGTYKAVIEDVAAGTYEFKIRVDASWDENYGPEEADQSEGVGVQDGKNLVIKVEEAGSTITITFDPETKMIIAKVTNADGISTVKVIDANGAIYNVAGQKVSNSYKGLVIKNGKKYIQK